MAHGFPMPLSATVTISGTRVIVNSNDAIVVFPIRVESVEWIWQELLGDGDRREERLITAATATLTAKGIEVLIGPEPNRLPLFRTLDGTRKGVLADRQASANRGEKGLWRVVTI